MNANLKNIKLFFLDLDGTLLDQKDSKGNLSVSDINKKGIEKAQADGKTIVISTGRGGPYVSNLMKELNIQYAVTANGAMVIDQKGKILKNDPLTIRQFLLLLDIIKEEKLSMKLDWELTSYGQNNWLMRKMSEKFGFIHKPTYNCQMHIPHSKIVVWGKSKSKLKKIKNSILGKVDDISIESSCKGWTLEITNIKSTKGLGNKFMADYLGIINKSDLIHVGDSMNDSTTTEYMKLIALKNATKELKKVAQYSGPNFKKGGVSKVLMGEFEEVVKK